MHPPCCGHCIEFMRFAAWCSPNGRRKEEMKQLGPQRLKWQLNWLLSPGDFSGFSYWGDMSLQLTRRYEWWYWMFWTAEDSHLLCKQYQFRCWQSPETLEGSVHRWVNWGHKEQLDGCCFLVWPHGAAAGCVGRSTSWLVCIPTVVRELCLASCQ